MREPPKEIHAFYAGSELVDEFYAKDFHILATDGVPWPYTTKYIRRDAITPAIAAQVLLNGLDKRWDKSLAADTNNARMEAKRNGHGYVLIDREGFRAALTAIAQEEGK